MFNALINIVTLQLCSAKGTSYRVFVLAVRFFKINFRLKWRSGWSQRARAKLSKLKVIIVFLYLLCSALWTGNRIDLLHHLNLRRWEYIDMIPFPLGIWPLNSESPNADTMTWHCWLTHWLLPRFSFLTCYLAIMMMWLSLLIQRCFRTSLTGCLKYQWYWYH